jgi:hypothetical protein
VRRLSARTSRTAGRYSFTNGAAEGRHRWRLGPLETARLGRDRAGDFHRIGPNCSDLTQLLTENPIRGRNWAHDLNQPCATFVEQGGISRCSICLADPCRPGQRDVISTNCCARQFCRGCLRDALAVNAVCPLCRAPQPEGACKRCVASRCPNLFKSNIL